MARLDFREWLAEDEQVTEGWARTKLAALTAALAMALTGCGGKPKDEVEKERIVKLAKDTAKIGPHGYMSAKELLEKHGIDAKSVIGDPPPPKVSEERPPARPDRPEREPAPVPLRPGVAEVRPDPAPLPLPPPGKPPRPAKADGPDMTRIPGERMNLGHVVQQKVSGPGRAYRHEYTLLDVVNSTGVEDACEALRINFRTRYKEQDIGDAFGVGKSPAEAVKNALERAQVQEENRIDAYHTAFTTRILGGRIVAVIVYARK